MERFMYLFRVKNDATSSADARNARRPSWDIWLEKLAKNGNLIGGEKLDDAGVLVDGPERIITDGPFIEAKEMIAGYLMINAKDMDDAVAISKDCPILAVGGKVEVRPLLKM